MAPPLLLMYFTLLGTWVLLHIIWGDAIGLMGLISPFAKYLFIPSLIIFPISLIAKERTYSIAGGISVAIFFIFWGNLLLPKNNTSIDVASTLKVMTYNAKGPNLNIENSIAMILEVDADIVMIQELNIELTKELEKLQATFPYQILNGRVGTAGMGIISKYPLNKLPISIDSQWVGEPMLASIPFNNQEIFLLNVHLIPPFFGDVKTVIEIRNRQAQSIRDFLIIADLPVIVGGDFNSTSLSSTYKIINHVANDTWNEVGQGFGHTFPGKDFANTGMMGLPEWLIRIDYLFVTDGITPLLAELAPSPDFSDHRGLIGVYDFGAK